MSRMSRNNYDDMPTRYERSHRQGRKTGLVAFLGVLITLVGIVVFLIMSPTEENVVDAEKAINDAVSIIAPAPVAEQIPEVAALETVPEVEETSVPAVKPVLNIILEDTVPIEIVFEEEPVIIPEPEENVIEEEPIAEVEEEPVVEVAEEPIIEVAVLFLGIFTTMTPALAYLNDNAASLGLDKVWQFYYTSGALSSFLDNTPTAVAFHSVASGLTSEQMAAFGNEMMAGIPEILLMAICIGSVFFGAMTYIGNGPNFMVKAIAEENGVKMPSFFGYMFKFSLIVLLPIYILVQLIFL